MERITPFVESAATTERRRNELCGGFYARVVLKRRLRGCAQKRMNDNFASAGLLGCRMRTRYARGEFLLLARLAALRPLHFANRLHQQSQSPRIMNQPIASRRLPVLAVLNVALLVLGALATPMFAGNKVW